MVPLVMIVAGCVAVATLAALYSYLYRVGANVSGDSDDDDDDEPGSEDGMRIGAESAALINGDNASCELENSSIYTYLSSLLGRNNANKKSTATLMQRRNKGTKKIHKPAFYPLLDETASWYADWEAKKHEGIQIIARSPSSNDSRIEKASDLHVKELEIADFSFSFRSSSHTIIPVGGIESI